MHWILKCGGKNTWCLFLVEIWITNHYNSKNCLLLHKRLLDFIDCTSGFRVFCVCCPKHRSSVHIWGIIYTLSVLSNVSEPVLSWVMVGKWLIWSCRQNTIMIYKNRPPQNWNTVISYWCKCWQREQREQNACLAWQKKSLLLFMWVFLHSCRSRFTLYVHPMPITWYKSVWFGFARIIHDLKIISDCRPRSVISSCVAIYNKSSIGHIQHSAVLFFVYPSLKWQLEYEVRHNTEALE